LGRYPAFKGLVSPFFDRPDIQLPFIWYAVPATNPTGPATVFGDRFWETRENFYPLSPSTVPGSLSVYRGPVPDGTLSDLVGSADDWVNGLSYATYLAGGYPGIPLCVPLATPCPNLPGQTWESYWTQVTGWVDIGPVAWSLLNAPRQVSQQAACLWESERVTLWPGHIVAYWQLDSGGVTTRLLLRNQMGAPPILGIWEVLTATWDGVKPLWLPTTSDPLALPVPGLALVSTAIYGDLMIPGLIIPFGGSSAPPGTLLCDGTAYPTSVPYDRVSSAVGNAWNTFRGAADPGPGMFRVPDLRGLVWAGSGAAVPSVGGWPATSAHALASAFGEERHTLITAELPAHQHASPDGADFVTVGLTAFPSLAGAGNNLRDSGAALTGPAGGGSDHQTLQPTAYGVWVIVL
jgi:microcystin-dependent protein